MMNYIELANLLGWCALINYSLLLLWFFVFSLAHDWLFRLHSRWFSLTVGQFDLINYGGVGLYKLLIFVFNLAPYLALRFII